MSCARALPRRINTPYARALAAHSLAGIWRGIVATVPLAWLTVLAGVATGMWTLVATSGGVALGGVITGTLTRFGERRTRRIAVALFAGAGGAACSLGAENTIPILVCVGLANIGFGILRPALKAETYRRNPQRAAFLAGSVAAMSGNAAGAVVGGLAVAAAVAAGATNSAWWIPSIAAATLPILALRTTAAAIGREAEDGDAAETSKRDEATSRGDKETSRGEENTEAEKLKKAARMILLGGIAFGMYNATTGLHVTFVVDRFGPEWAGPIQVAHVAGQLGALTLLQHRVLSRSRSSWDLTASVALFLPAVATAAGAVIFRAAGSVAGHIAQSRLETQTQEMAGRAASGWLGKFASTYSLVSMAAVPALGAAAAAAGWWVIPGTAAAATLPLVVNGTRNQARKARNPTETQVSGDGRQHEKADQAAAERRAA